MGQHTIGERFGDYTLVRPLGEGGFASVYLGKGVHDGTLAAVKLLREQQVHDFINEVRRTFRLRHPHIIEILDFGIRTPDNTAFIIMEYAPNGSFREKYPRGTYVPLDVVVPTVKQVASALQYAHDQRVIHRDVKPENLLLNAQKMVLLSDFGIATASRTALASNTGQTEQGDKIGTLIYMAPEQFRGHPVPASDQYSLAIMTYEWLCGELPFEGREYIHWQYLHENEPPPPLREYIPSLSPAFEQVVLKALAKKPEERFEQISQFALALERTTWGGDEPSVISTPRPTKHATQFDSSTNLARTHAKSVEQLFREGVQAQTNGNVEEAFRIWRQIMTTKSVPEQYSTTARNRILELRTQMIPLRLKQAREASMQGRWQDEIRLWEDLLVLEPSAQDLTPLLKTPLTLDMHSGAYFRGNNSLQSIQERLQIAQQNAQSVWMYTGAQQYIQSKDYPAARTQLQMLWHDALYYGDPLGLAQMVGLPPARNYEQALTEEQARQQREREAAKRERQKQQQRETAERERRKRKLEQDERKLEQDKKRRAIAARLRGIAAGISGGTGVGCLAGILLAGIWYTFAPPQRIPEQESLGHSLVSVLERVFIFFPFFPVWVSVIIAGVLAGLAVGAVVGCIRSIINPSCYASGKIAGGIVGFFAALFVLGIAGSLIGGFIVAALCVGFGPWLGMRVGAEMGESIGGKWEYRYPPFA